MQLNQCTIAQAAAGLKKKEFSSVELTEACLRRIHERNHALNAFITVADASALEEAKKADEQIAAGRAGTLTGIPFSVKDAICVAGVRATGAAKILDTYVPPYEATVIRRIRDAGGVMIGKTNCDAFGHGASNENSMYGPVRNPHDEGKVAGGSSGGSAASVADHMAIYSIAEDTGGSIRWPAAACGIVGFRPSYGRNSRYGIMPMASSLDTVGPMAKTVEDIAFLMEIMAGHDPKDATAISDAVPAYSKELKSKKSKKQWRIGIPKEYLELDGMDADVRRMTVHAIEAMRAADVEVVEISLPHTRYAIPVYYIIVPSEDSSNLARLDGARYGVRAVQANLNDMYAVSRAHGFPEEVKRRIVIGTYALSAGYYDAYYRKAQRVRTRIIEDFVTAFASVDVLIAPTSPFPAFDIGEKSDDVLAMYLADVFVSPAAVAGIPALSVPVGKTSAGLPVGMQVMGPRLGDTAVLSVGQILESVVAL